MLELPLLLPLLLDDVVVAAPKATTALLIELVDALPLLLVVAEGLSWISTGSVNSEVICGRHATKLLPLA